MKRSPIRKQALVYFNKEAKCNAEKWGYFPYSEKSDFGVSPDGLVSLDLLIEIKTRAADSELTEQLVV